MKNKQLKNIKVISFDVWGTLIKGNPGFKAWRTETIARGLGWDGDLVHVENIMRDVDVAIDKRADQTGQDFNFADRVKEIEKQMMIRLSPSNFSLPQTIRDNSFYADLEEKVCKGFVEKLPLLLEVDIVTTLKNLNEQGLKIAVSSNTGFIRGLTMRVALAKLGIFEHIDYAVFSNEVGAAKPSPVFFKRLSRISGVPAKSILHIGDNLEADYGGAWEFGINSVAYDPENKLPETYSSINKISNLHKLICLKDEAVPYSNIVLYNLKAPRKGSKKIIADSGEIFDTKLYSKFKYGDGKAAFKYGEDLAKKFIAENSNLFGTKSPASDLVVTTSPYKFIPKGASGIVRGFVDYFNSYLARIGKKPVTDIQIRKESMFEGDYGNFTEKERQKITQANKLILPTEYIRGKKVIVIDDMRITGSHEKNLLEFLSEKEAEKIFFLYVAVMDSAYAAGFPQIEHVINHSWMNSPTKLKKLMKSKNFLLNARVCKYILSIKNPMILKNLLSSLPFRVLKKLHGAIVGDGYAVMPLYRHSFREIELALKRHVPQRKRKIA